MKNLTAECLSQQAMGLSVEKWFDKYGVAILKREEAKKNLKTLAATAGR
jgi:hypothetical protein